MKSKTPLRKDLSDILAPFIAAMTFPIDFEVAAFDGAIDEAKYNSADYKILKNICNPHHAQPNFDVTIGGKPYTIDNYKLVGNKYRLYLRGTDAISVNSFELYKPKFLHGTVMAVSAETVDNKDVPIKSVVPFIFLIEEYKETFDDGWKSAIHRESQVQILFLTEEDITGKDTDTLKHNATEPMSRLVVDFIDMLKSHPECFFIDESFRNTDLKKTKLSVHVANKGYEGKQYFGNKFSGREMQTTLFIKKEYSLCEC